MSKKIYALLVGINEYEAPVAKLSGCLNDVDHFHAYLNDSFGKANLAVEVLKNSDSTRDNIIRLFRTHLCNAQADDVALFHYCGHGARWKSAKEFKQFYPDGWDEGLVCYDSRQENGYDLADKELAVLIQEVAKNNPHIAVILDCCHSGSGTRDVDAFRNMRPRQTRPVDVERPLDSYIGDYASKLKQKGGDRSFSIPTSRHILLAACERTQTAKESVEEHSGVFTSTILDVLRKHGSNVSYAELFKRCRSWVRTRAENQNPQFEVYNNFNAYAGFLGRGTSDSARRYRAFYEKDSQSWKIDAGAVVPGIPTDKGKSVGVALYRDDDPARSVGNASIIQVGPQTSDLQLSFPGETSVTYQAELTSFPMPPMPVYVEGDPKAGEILRKALDAAMCAQLGVDLTEIEGATRYAISAEAETFVLKQRETNSKILGAKGYTEASAQLLVPAIRNIVQWERFLALQNHSTQMNKADVDLVFTETLEDGKEYEHKTNDITVDVVKSGNDWKKIKAKIRLRNRTQLPKPLHFLLLYFSSAYGIYKLHNEPVPSSDAETTLYEDEFEVPEEMNESIDNFKLIVSTEKIDDFLLAQEEIEDFGKDVSPTRAPSKLSSAKKMVQNEWFTKNLRVRFIRQQDQVSSKDVSLAQGKIVIKSHSSVKANLSIRAAAVPTRGVGDGSDFYKFLEQKKLKMVNFAEGTRGDTQNILELTGIENAASLKENPLEIEVNVPLSESEGILPFVFDGQHVFLGGDAYKDDSGNTHISIDHIPDIPDNRRSLGGSLKLYFFKTYLKQNDVNQLRWVEYKADGSFEYHKDMVADKVAAAKNVLLLVHGIIGDTEAMAKGVEETGLDQKFDLVLTYDYENLSTPIAETAQKLKSQLAAAGLNETDNKKLTLLVHSMGGLVSRWFVEREGGNKVVDHLVMCGTPNNGSPFGKVDGARKILNVLTGLSVNYAPMFIPFSGAVLLLLNRSKKITPTLEQMNPESDFIRTLNTSEDPGIRYTILAGDVETYTEPSDEFFAKMLSKVGKSSIFESLFGMKANDIAVSVESILGVERKITPARKNVACHHLNYFVSEAGQKALTAVEW